MSAPARLADILRETLEIDDADFGRPFLDVGGNSLRAALVVDAAESAGIDIGIDQLYRAPTLWAVVEAVRGPGDRGSDALALTRTQRAVLDRTPTARWRLAVLRPAGADWNDQILEVAARGVLGRYDALRVRLTTDGLGQRVTDLPVAEDVLARVHVESRPNGWDLRRLLPDPGDVRAVPLTHFVLLDHDGPDRPWLLVGVHPVLCDAASFDRVVRALRTTVAVVLDGEPVLGEPARPTWRDWCRHENLAPGPAPATAMPMGPGPGAAVWRAVGTVLTDSHAVPELDLPVDDPAEDDRSHGALGLPPQAEPVGCYTAGPARRFVAGRRAGAPDAPPGPVPEIRIRRRAGDRVVTPPGTAAGLLLDVRSASDTLDLTWYVDPRRHDVAAVATTAGRVTGALARLDPGLTVAARVLPTGVDWAGAGDE
ncbi:Phosphopantetheine attachment site [Micromonospora haikouensis]|uniref:Phosphopantetheine attachment site n=1 Tax=Micromonospora haikouensis TaxID=686309 RepID=A0A1C4XH11_9ACTN|nr:phosphopantetheine-binding protein [Micromonospora haikouensis]SCF07622.1 Phosphopantetheine attachment site [Micromonospora haikouensis]